MGISGVGQSSFYHHQSLANMSSARQPADAGQYSSLQSEDSELQELIKYFDEPPAQRVIDNWLSAHHISKEQYDAMTPEQQEALKKQMATDIKNNIEKRAEEKSKIGVDLLA